VRLLTLTVGRDAFAIPAGQTETIFVPLNQTGRGLLARFHRLPVTLSVTLTNGESATPTLIAQSRLLIKPAARAHHQKRHRRRRHRR
jgi:hypothetical protein